jgi:hypothetical protein
MVRDRRYLEAMRRKGLTHETLGLSSGELKQPTPFSLHNSYFSKRDGEFLSLGHRQSVTRHHWGVVNGTDLAGPPAADAPRRAAPLPALPHRHRDAVAADGRGGGHSGRRSVPAESAQQGPASTRLAQTVPGPVVAGRTEYGLKAGRGFERADKGRGRWVLQFVPAVAHGESVRKDRGANARSATSLGAHARDSAGTGGRPRSKSAMGSARAPEADDGDVDPAKGRTGAALQAIYAERKRKKQDERRLLKTLRTKMQLRFKDTSHLPINLWKAFERYDADGSGRIEQDEFVKVCEHVGIDESMLGKNGIQALFRCADKNGSGDVDFQEFLSAVVGNLVNL